MEYSHSDISTFVRHMVCPPRLSGCDSNDLSALGVEDFNTYPYRHLPDRYAGSSIADVDLLLEEMVSALNATVDSNKKPLLLLSDGKDSMGLALAFQKMGRSVETLTFLRKNDAEMQRFVKSAVESMGHTPYFITVDEIVDSFDLDYYLKACGFMENPVLDQGLLFFVFGVRKFFLDNAADASDYVLVDGLGNDETFGYLPSSSQLKSYKLSKLGAWKIIPSAMGNIRWFIRSPCESHGDLSALSYFFEIPEAHEINRYFARCVSPNDALSFIDFRAFSRGSFHDHQCMMGKTRVAAGAIGSEVVFPWVEPKLKDYIFNLPAEKKFNFPALKNKLLLRELLSRHINWEQTKRGVDLYFDLDLDGLRSGVLSDFVPVEFISTIDRKIAPVAVKQRAYMELMNFTGYCLARGWGYPEMLRILSGKQGG